MGLFLLLAVCFLAVVLPQHIKELPSSHRHHLDSGGLGAAVWGSVLILICIQFHVIQKVEGSETCEDTANAEQPGTSSRELEEVLGKHEIILSCKSLMNPFGKFGSFLFLLLRLIGNFACILQLPHPPTCCGNGHRFRTSFLTSQCCSHCRWRVPWQPRGGWSMQSGERVLRPELSRVCCSKSPCPWPVFSVLVKVRQVDFITEKIVWDWSVWEYLALAGFINNLAGLHSDQGRSKVKGMFLYMDSRNEQAAEEAFMKESGSFSHGALWSWWGDGCHLIPQRAGVVQASQRKNREAEAQRLLERGQDE